MRFCAVLALAALPAQSPAPAPVATRTVDFWVEGEKGAAVEGLGADEVAVLEDGTARVVTRVARDTRPLTVAILVDSSAPQSTNYRLQFVEAVEQFVRLLPEGTRYAVWTTGDRPRKVVDFTEDRTQAGRALRKAFPTGGNTVFDALVEVGEVLQGREAERTAIVVLSGTGIGFTNRNRQHVRDAVRKNGAAVYAVQVDDAGSAEFRGEGADQVSRIDYDYVLGSLPEDTGGLHERALSAMGADTALRRVATALAGRYRATYAADDERKPRKVTVQVARPGVTVHVGGAER